ncbi:MAG: type IV secretion protein Dot [Legionella sp.]|nr:type IV secretion protein Dot [Legionella sp.]
MDTNEHTELGNELRLNNITNTRYLRIDKETGVLYLRLQRFGDNNLPEPMELELSAGEIMAMAGDYFTQKNWTMTLNLPHCERFEKASDLGHYLINQEITEEEEVALITAYNNLAAPDVTRKMIERIYNINNSTYIPFSSSLNFYVQQLMLYLRVKNYGEMVTRNQTHFTPWSIKVYMLGHAIALRYARLSYELKQLAQDSYYQSLNPDVYAIKNYFALTQQTLTKEVLNDFVDRLQAQAYSMELFTFHYYSDHFATGHMSMVGDLRVKLQDRFGVWGSILANNLHDEINRIGAYTSRPYNPNPNPLEPPTRARGDGKFNSCLNGPNRQQCLAGMTESLNDLHQVFNGGNVPSQNNFGGLKHLPDIDYTIRQHQPLIVLSANKIYYRTNLATTQTISPTEYDAIRANPAANGYTELTSKWSAFVLVAKLRLFPYLYPGSLLPLPTEKLRAIELDERSRNPDRAPIEEDACGSELKPAVLDWREQRGERPLTSGLLRNSLFSKNKPSENESEHTELLQSATIN